jgi:hypothetical protein
MPLIYVKKPNVEICVMCKNMKIVRCVWSAAVIHRMKSKNSTTDEGIGYFFLFSKKKKNNKIGFATMML